MMPIRVHFITYGCTFNQADTDAMKKNIGAVAGNGGEKGFEIAECEEKADVIVVNSCSVKGATEQKILFKAKKIAQSGKKLIIAGCLAQTEKEIVEQAVPSASLLGTFSSGRLADALRETAAGNKVAWTKKTGELPFNVSVGGVIARVQICRGCLGFCAYCSTRLARGRLESFKPEKIVAGIGSATAIGAKEIQLCAQDAACYGFDFEAGEQCDLADLIGRICEIDGRFRIRIGMGNPEHFGKIKGKIAEVVEKNGKVYKFLHIPVQSGSDDVLKAMKRDYSAKDYVELTGFFKREIPGVTIETDVIVGFPGETEEDFQKTVGLIEKTRPAITNVSKFSARPGTAAMRMQQVDGNEIKRRSEVCSEICKRIAREENEKMVGETGIALVTERKGILFSARTANYKTVLLQNAALGGFVKVEIASAEQSHLKCAASGQLGQERENARGHPLL